MRKGADRLNARLKSKQQGRLDSFFTVKPKDPKDVKKRKVSAAGLTSRLRAPLTRYECSTG